MPVRIDYSECVRYFALQIGLTSHSLFDIMSFFAGDLDGKNGHDDFAERIAAQGKLWTDEHFRKEDLQACAYALPSLWFLSHNLADSALSTCKRRWWLIYAQCFASTSNGRDCSVRSSRSLQL